MPDEIKDDTSTATAVADKPDKKAPAPADTALTPDPEAPADPPKPGEVVVTEGGTGTQDILGGGISETRNIPVTATVKDRNHAQRLLIRAAKAAGTAKLAMVTGRPLTEWGLVGEGDEVVGHFILVDLDTLDKIETIDRYRVEGDHIYANAQQLPKALVAGGGLKQL